MKKTPIYNLDLDVYEETLDNGLKVFIIPKCDVNNTYVTFSTNYGSIQNEFVPINEKEMVKVPDGVAHFLEHKVFEQKDGIDPFTFYSKTGADCNANTSNYKTTYLFIGQSNLKDNLNYLLDFVQEPYFTEENVEKEKGIIEQELKMYKDDPITCAYETLTFNAFVNHPIKIPVGGTVESIKEITKDDLYTCYNTFYHPSNMFVVITGNVDPNDAISIIKENQKKKDYKKIEKIELKKYDEPDNVYKEKEILNMNVTVPKVFVAYKFNIENINLNTKTILNYIGIFADLKFGAVSLFSEKLKQKEIILSDIYYSTIKTDKHVVLILETESKNQDEVIEEIDKEISKDNILETEFNRKKKTAISSCIYMSDSIFRLNSLIMNEMINTKKFNPDIYKHYKNLNYNDFIKFRNKINFRNKSILLINPNK